jgi:dienelactone hydrolase
MRRIGRSTSTPRERVVDSLDASERALDQLLQKRSALALPESMLARIVALGLPTETVEEVLGAIRSLDDWMIAWTRMGQQWVAVAKREDISGRWRHGALARRHAALCYHAAHFITAADQKTVLMLRSTAAGFFAQAAPYLYEMTERIYIPWKEHNLPAYLRRPTGAGSPFPLVIVFNGATTIKEETLIWSDPIVNAGWAVLAVDWPGTGEATAIAPLSGEGESVVVSILTELERDPRVDKSRIAALGFSLGATPVVRGAERDPRISAVILVTPPFDPPAWPALLDPLMARQLLLLTDDGRDPEDVIASFSLRASLDGWHCPALIFGAGQDRVAPPDEADRVAHGMGEWATLVRYPYATHGLYDVIDDWPYVAAEWLTALISPQPVVPDQEQMADPRRTSGSPLD